MTNFKYTIKHKTFNLLLIAVLPISVFYLSGCTTETVVTGEYYTAYKDIAYGETNRQVLDLYIPNGTTGVSNMILMIHGGGWVDGDKECYDGDLDSWAKNEKVICASLNYRYASRKITGFDILDDIDSALLTIKNRASELGINIQKVLLTGGSAGAHLALLYAYARCDTAPIKPAAVVSYCGPTDLTDDNFFDGATYLNEIVKWFSWLGGYKFKYETVDDAKPSLALVSPITYVTSNSVPTVICHGTVDEIVPFSNATALVQKLTELNVEHEFVIYPNSGHALADDPAASEKANELFKQYVDLYLK